MRACSPACVVCASREMKRGNLGLAMGMMGQKLRSSLGGTKDYGLTGKDGVVHPSLAVRPAHVFTLSRPRLVVYDFETQNTKK